MMEVSINGNSVSALVDSGANDNLLDEGTYQSMVPVPQLVPSTTKLYPYSVDSAIDVLGQFQAQVQANRHGARATFRVVKGLHGNLLGFDVSKRLNLFDTAMFRSDKRSVNNTRSFYDDLMLRYDDVLTDKIGRLKGHKVKLHIDPEAKPVQTRMGL